uniref:Uncharacterized protein n=1 Tax=Leptocylindrus aporus TaxID=1398097 RepID=A0A7S0KA48_9STRA|mmetsp:Transcript_315/g.390  ORF Transcript_315/g.390 Transcript_315/m.390 type:complete len:290 (+) Transcript_315:191-1060(+)
MMRRRNRCNGAADEDSVLTIKSASSALTRIGEKISPRRRRIRKQQLAAEEAANEIELDKRRLRPKSIAEEDLRRYEELSRTKKIVYGDEYALGDTLPKQMGENGLSFDAERPLPASTSGWFWFLFPRLALMFVVYDETVIDLLMHIDDNMFPVVVGLCLLLFVNVSRGIGTYIIDTIEKNGASLSSMKESLVFVRRNLSVATSVFYVICWVISGTYACVKLYLLNMVREQIDDSDDDINGINWALFQYESLGLVKWIIKYISCFFVCALMFVETAIKYKFESSSQVKSK